MNRIDEYWALVNELSQPPAELAGSVDRARKRARREQVVKRLESAAASLVGLAAAFVLLVNVFPTFALACSGVPIVRELAAAVAFSPSLSAAVAHDYVQYIGKSQTVDGVTVNLEYAIVDRHQAVFFYSVDGAVRFYTSPTITAADGEPVGGYATSNTTVGDNAGAKDLNSLTLSVTAGDGLPDQFTLEMFFKVRPYQEVMDSVAPSSVYAPEEETEFLDPRKDPDALHFAFDIALDPARIIDGTTVEVDQWVNLDGQRILVDRLELFPTRTILYLEEDEANTAWLRSLKFSFVDEKGNCYDNIDGVLSASGEEESKSYLTYYFQSFYYNRPENLTLCIDKAEWQEKDIPHVILDLTTGEADNLPDGVWIDEVTYSSSGRTTMVKVISPPVRQGFAQTFGQTYWDPEGGEHFFNHWGSGKEFNEDDEEIGQYELIYFDDYPWDTVELELSYTSVSEYGEPVLVELF